MAWGNKLLELIDRECSHPVLRDLYKGKRLALMLSCAVARLT